uniref:Uncharacterized protein n=1 Tax=Fundulus heteroclitus TaxID=8078 RepID=A0A3Q2QWK2_FUNHE
MIRLPPISETCDVYALLLSKVNICDFAFVGAPMTAVYKFLRCNPEGGKANCVTQQTPEMPWSPDLPSKLPASDILNLKFDHTLNKIPEMFFVFFVIALVLTC